MPLYDWTGKEIGGGTPGRPLKPRKPHKKPVPRPINVPHRRRQSVKAQQARTQSREVTVQLYARHHINGQDFGPGKVTVPHSTAETLLEQERNAARADAQFMGTRAFLIGPGRLRGFQAHPVAPEVFDAAAEMLLPFGVVNRNTLQYSGAVSGF